MKTISAVDLRNDLEGIVKSLKRGERMELTYRGEIVAELKPIADEKRKREEANAAFERIWARTRQIPDYARKAEEYIQEVYEDRKSYGDRNPE
jgi:antitoxin (DNA-binding transcriptional repressor) of toxin-antitoxin stability system